MRHAPPLCGCLALFLALVGTSPANAGGSYRLAPATASLSPGRRVTSITISNTGQAESLMQVEVFRWSQVGGKDVLDPSDALLVSPAVFRLQPGGSQVMRIALRGKPSPPTVEGAFRIFVTEVPVESDTRTTGVAVSLRFSLPIFIEPAVPVRALSWTIQPEGPGRAALSLTNRGSVHAHVGRVELAGCGAAAPVLFNGTVADYVLPGESRSWPLTLIQGAGWDATCPVALRVESSTGREEFRLLPALPTSP